MLRTPAFHPPHPSPLHACTASVCTRRAPPSPPPPPPPLLGALCAGRLPYAEVKQLLEGSQYDLSRVEVRTLMSQLGGCGRAAGDAAAGAGGAAGGALLIHAASSPDHGPCGVPAPRPLAAHSPSVVMGRAGCHAIVHASAFHARTRAPPSHAHAPPTPGACRPGRQWLCGPQRVDGSPDRLASPAGVARVGGGAAQGAHATLLAVGGATAGGGGSGRGATGDWEGGRGRQRGARGRCPKCPIPLPSSLPPALQFAAPPCCPAGV